MNKSFLLRYVYTFLSDLQKMIRMCYADRKWFVPNSRDANLFRIGIKHTCKLIAGCFLFLAVFGMMFQSCIKKEDFDFSKLSTFEWSPNVAAPLIHSKLSMHDILSATQLIQEDANHFLTLVYRSTVFSKRADELITIPNQIINTNIGFSTGGITIGDSVVIPYSSVFTFTTTNGERFDSILIKTGNLNFSINGDINHNGRIYITIPNAKKNGVPFNKTIYYDYSGSLPIIDVSILDGYTLSFAPGNQITINYSVAVYGDANPDTSPYNLSMSESITGITFFKIFGYLGQIPLSFSRDSVMIDIFKNTISGSIILDDPRLNIYVNNAFGTPLAFTIDTLNAYSPVNPPYMLAINPTGLPYPWQIAAPTFAQMGQSVETVFHLDKTNSNIDDAVNMAPNFITYYANALTNPLGDPLAQNFVIDTSKIRLDGEVELPLSGSAWNFELQDTIDFDMGKDVDKLEWVLFKINTTNGFPIDVDMQVYFADSLYQKLDSLLASPVERIISSGTVGPPPDYKVISPFHKYTSALIDKNKLGQLGATKNLIIHARLATANAPTPVKLYSDYDIDVKIGVQAQFKFNVNPH